MIQARDLTFNIEYGRYIKPLELITKKETQFGKGRNIDISNKIYKLAKRYTYYTEADHMEFDAHVTKEHLKLTHTYYQSCYHHSKPLRKLSKRTLINKCKTLDGIKYKVHGTRMSGDVDTSFGNSLINYALLKQALSDIGLEGEVIVNGDDSIIFTNKPIPQDQFIAALATYNMETKLNPSVTNIHKVEFCRQKLIINNRGEPALAMLPDRLLTIFGMTYKNLGDYMEYLRIVILCFISINSRSPLAHIWYNLYQEFFKPISLQQIRTELETVDLHRDYRRSALKELQDELDTPDYNQTIYNAFGNLDFVETRLSKIRSKMKWIQTQPKISTETLKTYPVNRLIIINHDTKQTRQITI